MADYPCSGRLADTWGIALPQGGAQQIGSDRKVIAAAVVASGFLGASESVSSTRRSSFVAYTSANGARSDLLMRTSRSRPKAVRRRFFSTGRKPRSVLL